MNNPIISALFVPLLFSVLNVQAKIQDERPNILLSATLPASEYHVSKKGNDAGPGTIAAPLLTIQTAANAAQPGDVIIVHEGVYREKIVPPRGGISDSKRIVYKAAEGEEVHIKGSEIIKNWKQYDGDVWKAVLPNSFFDDYNPYKELIQGDWFNDLGREHHTGEVYLNGISLWEMDDLDNVLHPVKKKDAFDPEGSLFTWYCETDAENTTIYANFQGANPNNELVEINVRNSCFYPGQTGVNYITISGFRISQAATNWAAPTAEQVGLIGTNWSKGWIIENNVISDSRCSGITLGKDRASGHNAAQHSKKGGTLEYIEIIFDVQQRDWSKENVGSHIVRNNIIYNCGQTGICGSLGAVYSIVSNNHIYDIWRKRQFTGFEIGGIKFHAPIDCVIRDNVVHDTYRGIWLDWMTQGTRISSNICYRNDYSDFFAEVNHGPYLVDNNIFLSGILSMSQGGAYVHNLITGKVIIKSDRGRYTPYHLPHSTEIMGFANIRCGDDRFYNNIFMKSDYDIGSDEWTHQGYGLDVHNQVKNTFPVYAANNVYYPGTIPYENEKGPLVADEFEPVVKVEEEAGRLFLVLQLDESLLKVQTETVTTTLLGKTIMAEMPYENPDGSALTIDTDFTGKKRDSDNPVAGPFENLKSGRLKIDLLQCKKNNQN